jgi:hypothetical protein
MEATLRRLTQKLHLMCHPHARRQVLTTLAIAMQEPLPPRLVGRPRRHWEEQQATAHLHRVMRHIGGAS